MDIPNVYDIIKQFGYIGIFATVFLEMGVFFCFFLPGDSLLLITGALAAKGVFSLSVLLIGIFVISISAYWFNYGVGSWFSDWIWGLPNKYFYKREYLEKAERFYHKYGAWAIIGGRFLPVIRTFVPLIAGLVKMSFSRFSAMNAIGSFIWGVGLVLVGYGIGRFVPVLLDHMAWLLLGIIVVSLIPVIHELVKRIKSSWIR